MVEEQPIVHGQKIEHNFLHCKFDILNKTVEIVQTLDKLKNDKDIEVSNFAFDTDNRSIL